MNDPEQQKSIFDLVEAQPRIFTWSKVPEDLVYKQSETLYDNSLAVSRKDGTFKTTRCVLTHQGLFKYKVYIVIIVV